MISAGFSRFSSMLSNGKIEANGFAMSEKLANICCLVCLLSCNFVCNQRMGRGSYWKQQQSWPIGAGGGGGVVGRMIGKQQISIFAHNGNILFAFECVRECVFSHVFMRFYVISIFNFEFVNGRQNSSNSLLTVCHFLWDLSFWPNIENIPPYLPENTRIALIWPSETFGFGATKH